MTPWQGVLASIAVVAIALAIAQLIGPAVALVIVLVCAVVAFGPWIRASR